MKSLIFYEANFKYSLLDSLPTSVILFLSPETDLPVWHRPLSFTNILGALHIC